MVNGKMPLALTLAAAGLLAGVVMSWQPYSTTSPWDAYTIPARRFLGAAARHDSGQLSRLSLGATTVQWAVAAAEHHPDSLAYWARHAQAWTGTQHGDTAQVFVSAPNSGCNLVLQFVGLAPAARVGRASSACFEAP
jgi:hypothetical protein